MKAPRFLLVDDHPLMRRGVRQLLEETYPEASIAEAENAEIAIEQLRQQPFDLVVLDISLPGLSGVDALSRLQRVRGPLPILMLSMHGEDAFAIRALKAGAAGYLTKEQAGTHLMQAVRDLLDGKRYVSARLAQALAARVAGGAHELPHLALSDREFQVLRLIGSGRTVGEISKALSLSVKTISTYRARILLKMQMHTNAELTRYCIEQGLS